MNILTRIEDILREIADRVKKNEIRYRIIAIRPRKKADRVNKSRV
jgi:hypothetical protein